jgi:type IV pilus assembly protein PilA
MTARCPSKRCRGFTLIELMIVVAIIGVLAAIALPQFQDYVSRSRWSDNFARVAYLKQAIAECSQNNGLTVAACSTLGAPGGTGLIGNGFLPSDWVAPSDMDSPYLNSAITWAGGAITLVGSAQASGCTVTMIPTVGPGGAIVNWQFQNTAGTACNRSKTGVGT